MKKLLTLLLTLLMVFTLVGCNSKEQPPVVDEPQQEVVEPKDDVPIVGGYVEVEDGTLTDELKDIFNTALKGLMGATYEPQELVTTQVVAGTNYKFLANGTKTTNPITKGTYYITIYKDLQGNVELLDIEVIEEKQEETPKQDVTQMSFWVVFYDQYGNELQREALKYGTVPVYKSWLPEGFDKWVYKKSQKDVGSLKAITGNTYYQAVCHEVHHSSGGGSDPTPTPTVTKYTVSFNLNGATGTAPNEQTIESGKKATAPTNPSFSDHTFTGWYKAKDDAGKLSDPWNFETDVVTANMTLYAQWKRSITNIINTIDFPMYTSDVPTNAWVNISKQNIKMYASNNIMFYRLCVKNNSQSEFQIASFGTSINDYVEKIGNSSYVFSNDIFKYVVTFNMLDGVLNNIKVEALDGADTTVLNVAGTYTAPSPTPATTYTVAFDLNGIEGTAPNSQTVEENGKVTKPENPTSDVCVFAGWYTEQSCENKWDFDTQVTSSFTLYAKWLQFNTISDILTTIDFPTSNNKEIDPDNSWISENNKCYIVGNTLCLWTPQIDEETHVTQINTSYSVTKDGNNYSYNGVVTFTINEGKLSSIDVNFSGQLSKYNGTYSPNQ